MSTLTDALQNSSVFRHLLLEITAGKRIQNWVAQGSPNVWKAALTLTVTSVQFDGASLTVETSIADVSSNVGSYYWDGSFVYVHPPAATSVYTSCVMPMVLFLFANIDGVLNGKYYEARFKSAPVISSRIESKFGQVSQVGGGSISLTNGDKYLSGLVDIQWSAATAVVKLGADIPGHPVMAYSDYQTMAVWQIDDWTADDDLFILKFSDQKARKRNQLNLTYLTAANYPAADASVIGSIIPIAYGVQKSIKPICIDKANKVFIVANHAIWRFDGVRINTGTGNSANWITSTFVTTDLSMAQFTLGGDWNGSTEIAVDFCGKKNGDGTLMENAADIVQDLLANIGETNIDSTAFDLAEARLDIGSAEVLGRSTVRKYSRYIDSADDALSIIGDINAHCFSYAYINNSGQFAFGVFEPVPSEGLTKFDDLDIRGWSEETDVVPNGVYLLSDIYASYAQYVQEGFSQLNYQHDAGIWRMNGFTGPTILSEQAISDGSQSFGNLSLPLKFQELLDAIYWAQRELVTDGRVHRLFNFSVQWRGAFLLPGQLINVAYARQNYSATVEIYDAQHNLATGEVKLICGDLRGFRDQTGFWVADSPTLPTRFSSDAGYGAGAASPWNVSWSAGIKAWARANVGYFSDDNGFIDATDPDSYLGSVWF